MRKKPQKREAAITPRIEAWFLENYHTDCLVEVKIKGEKPKPHQMAALEDVVKGQFYWKFRDGHTRTPADFVMLKRAHAIVVTYDPKTKWAVGERVGTDIIFRFRP